MISIPVCTASWAMMEIRHRHDVDRLQRAMRQFIRNLGFHDPKETELLIAVRELAQNAWQHGGGGIVCWHPVTTARGQGIEIICKDDGPGIVDIAAALRDGSGTGLGAGLGAAQRLTDHLAIQSRADGGLIIHLQKWL